MVADISPEVLFIVHAGDSAVSTVPIESYTLFLPLDFNFNFILFDFLCAFGLHVEVNKNVQFCCCLIG